MGGFGSLGLHSFLGSVAFNKINKRNLNVKIGLPLQLIKQLCLFAYNLDVFKIFPFFLHVLEHLNHRTMTLLAN